jgi:hypothetical protein
VFVRRAFGGVRCEKKRERLFIEIALSRAYTPRHAITDAAYGHPPTAPLQENKARKNRRHRNAKEHQRTQPPTTTTSPDTTFPLAFTQTTRTSTRPRP